MSDYDLLTSPNNSSQLSPSPTNVADYLYHLLVRLYLLHRSCNDCRFPRVTSHVFWWAQSVPFLFSGCTSKILLFLPEKYRNSERLFQVEYEKITPGMSSTPLLGPAPSPQPAMAGCVSILRGIVFLLNIIFWVIYYICSLLISFFTLILHFFGGF